MQIAASFFVLIALISWLDARFLRLPMTIGVMDLSRRLSLLLVGLNALGLLQSVSAYEASLRHLVDFPGLLMNGMLPLFASPPKPLPMTTTSKGSFMRACPGQELSLSSAMRQRTIEFSPAPRPARLSGRTTRTRYTSQGPGADRRPSRSPSPATRRCRQD